MGKLNSNATCEILSMPAISWHISRSYTGKYGIMDMNGSGKILATICPNVFEEQPSETQMFELYAMGMTIAENNDGTKSLICKGTGAVLSGYKVLEIQRFKLYNVAFFGKTEEKKGIYIPSLGYEIPDDYTSFEVVEDSMDTLLFLATTEEGKKVFINPKWQTPSVKFDECGTNSYGFRRLKNNGMWSYLNMTTGKKIRPFSFKGCEDFTPRGYALVTTLENKQMIVDTIGELWEP